MILFYCRKWVKKIKESFPTSFFVHSRLNIILKTQVLLCRKYLANNVMYFLLLITLL